MSLLPAHTPGKDEADDDERTAGGLHADDPRADDGLGTERPRYAFGYAPADDDLDDEDDLDDDVTDDAAADGNAAGTTYETADPTAGTTYEAAGDTAGTTYEAAGDTAADDDLADDDLAGGYRADDPAVTSVSEVPGDPVPTVEVPAAEIPADSAPAYPVTADPASTVEVPTAEVFPAYETAVPATPVFTPRTADEGEPTVAAAVATSPGLDEPLLAVADATGFRARWHQAQSSFVDDPKAAVTEAAALVEQTAKAIADTLEQRQRQLREQWDVGQADDSAAVSGEPGTGGPVDTERLRLTMRSYRALFNQLCAP